MTFFRANLARIAAFAVLLWMGASGLAFAQGCISTADMECDHCWVEAKPAALKTQAAVDIQLAAVAMAAPPRAVGAIAVPVPVRPGPVRGFGPADLHPRERIPIEFLRLAL